MVVDAIVTVVCDVCPVGAGYLTGGVESKKVAGWGLI